MRVTESSVAISFKKLGNHSAHTAVILDVAFGIHGRKANEPQMLTIQDPIFYDLQKNNGIWQWLSDKSTALKKLDPGSSRIGSGMVAGTTAC